MTKNIFNIITKDKYKIFLEYLFSIQDKKYKIFTCKLIPNYTNIIGIRTPILKDIAKNILKENFINYFETFDNLKKENHIFYHEEKIIYAYVIANSKENFEQKLKRINNFVELIDNWAICDSACSSFKFILKNKKEYYSYLISKLNSKNIWEQRFILVSLLSYYIEKEYLNKIFELTEKIISKEYYVNIAKAWLLSICYIKFSKKTSIFLENSSLNSWTINKTVQKIRESSRISKEEKEKILKFKR